MTSSAEYALKVCTRRDEITGDHCTVFQFSTVREFRSFQYRIDVEQNLDPATRTIMLRIGGVSAPSTLVPSSGAATTEVVYQGLAGQYDVLVTGARQSESFRLMVDGENAAIEPVDAGGFVALAPGP